MTNHRSNVDQVARDALEDLGVLDDDRTEDLRGGVARYLVAPAPTVPVDEKASCPGHHTQTASSRTQEPTR